ncbi:MAG: hypothetical protein IPK21_21820 [Haliscomenobacter sp.]|nr:hypothetical protein [Haliscomenobacter sp.]
MLKNTYQKVSFPFPSTREQHRIVAKLDALMERVERNKQRLDKIPALLKRFRQSVLAAAVSGRLTEGWRRENEDVSNLIQTLEKIKVWRLKNAKTESKRQAILQIFGTIEAGGRFEIPDNWKFVHLNKICDSFSYGTSPKKSENEGGSAGS